MPNLHGRHITRASASRRHRHDGRRQACDTVWATGIDNRSCGKLVFDLQNCSIKWFVYFLWKTERRRSRAVYSKWRSKVKMNLALRCWWVYYPDYIRLILQFFLLQLYLCSEYSLVSIKEEKHQYLTNTKSSATPSAQTRTNTARRNFVGTYRVGCY